MLDTLAPARRRLVLASGALVALALVAGVAAAVLARGADVDPAPQDAPGPVLLVPGYGGSTAALEVLAGAIRAEGREAVLVRARDSTGDLGEQARDLGAAVDAALAETDAPSVDLVGYSAGGVVVRLWVVEDEHAGLARRVVTLAAPHHGTDLASAAGQLGGAACAEACRQLARDSDLLRRLNAGDETPAGPRWFTLWTEDDATVVPADSGSLDGAVGLAVQAVCPGLEVGHADFPRRPEVIGLVLDQLGVEPPSVPRTCPAGEDPAASP